MQLEQLAKAALRDEQINGARHSAAVAEIELTAQIRAREVRRAQDFEDAALEGKVRDLQRRGDIADADVRTAGPGRAGQGRCADGV